jgi:acetyltransferase-like isoleucine patch superfamily enzyme
LPPYHRRASLASLSSTGFIDPEACLDHPRLIIGRSAYLGKGVIVFDSGNGGPIRISDQVRIYGDAFIETGSGGTICIGRHTHLQPGCHIHSHRSSVVIGDQVEIAAQCAFYNYNHGMDPSLPVMDQPITSKGAIRIGDGAWLGHGVTVLQGVRIGKGAVIAAGAVVTRDIPDHRVAAGVPARVIKRLSNNATHSPAPTKPPPAIVGIHSS